jgi:CRP/FNR family transcriptional regulator, cyclic AMP receptor protein
MADYDWPVIFDKARIVTRYPAGATVITQGQPVSALVVICTGASKVTMTTSAGKSIMLKICGAGEVIGLADLLGEKTSSIQCTVLFDSEVSFIPWRDFEQRAFHDINAAKSVLAELARELRSERERIRTLVSPSVRWRMAMFLKSLPRCTGANREDHGIVSLPYTYEQIAEMVGCTRESVSRLISEFENAGAIIRRGTRLRFAADFDQRISNGRGALLDAG